MTLDQLRYFYETARFQHVGKAAKFVHISPSAISAAIASLEAELNCNLFDRVGKSIHLTDAGRKLKTQVERIFDQILRIREEVTGESGQLSGRYRVGASHFLASRYLTPAWSDLQNEHPGLIGEICSLATAHVLRDVLSSELDLGLCFSPLPHPDLAHASIYEGKLVVAVRVGHPILKSSAKKAIRELSHFPAVIHKGLPGVELCEAHPIFSRYGITPQIQFLFNDDACAVERIVSSDSWGMVPDVVARDIAESWGSAGKGLSDRSL